MQPIFISSTFRDMNAERDLFHQRIGPALDSIAREYGESISFCDLRWGVDTTQLETEAGARKVLSVCLQEIDRCRPFMVVLLGERYGWIPSRDLMAQAVGRCRNFRLDELEKSITALEIEYGALADPRQLERTLFYFRELEGDPPEDYHAESPDHAVRLAALKQRIVKLTCGRVKTYRVTWDAERNSVSNLDRFAETVIADIRRLMAPEWEKAKALTPYQRDQRSQWEFARQKAAQFAARFSLAQHYVNLLASDTHRFAIQAPSGAGKSTLMSQLTQMLDTQVLPIFCGTTPLCTTAIQLARYLAEYLETELGTDHFARRQHPRPPDIYAWRSRLDELAAQYSRSGRRPLTILIDAVDQLSPGKSRDELLFLPSRPHSKVSFVLSCLDSFPLPKDLHAEWVPPLVESDREAIVQGILKPTGRELGAEVRHAIVTKEGSLSPLYLSLLISRLEMMDREDFELIERRGGNMEQINRRQIELIRNCPADLEELCVEILEAAAQRLGSDLPSAAADFLAVSRHGLREQDLEGIFRSLELPWDSLNFSRFRLYMSRFFVLYEDGRLDFSHKTFRSGLLRRLGDPTFYHRVLFRHLEGLDISDPLRQAQILYHSVWSDNDRFFADYIYDHFMDTETIREAATVTAERIRKDSGSWLCRVLQGDANNLGYPMVRFITVNVFDAFSEKEDRSALRRVMEQNLELAKKVYSEESKEPPFQLLTTRYMLPMPWHPDSHDYQRTLFTNAEALDNPITTGVLNCKDPREQQRIKNHCIYPKKNDDARLLAFTCDRLAQLREAPETALALYAQSEALYRLLRQQAPGDIHDLLLCHNLHSQGKLHEAMNAQEKAMCCYRQEMDISHSTDSSLTRQVRAICAQAMARVTAAQGANPMAYYRLAIDVWESLLQTPPDPAMKKAEGQLTYERPIAVWIQVNLRNCILLAIKYLEKGGAEDRPRAAQLHKRYIELWEEDYKRKPDTKGRQALCAVCERAAAFFAKSAERKDILQALLYYSKSLEHRKVLIRDPGTRQEQLAMADLLERSSSLYERSGIQNAMQTAQKLNEWALRLRREQQEEEDSPAARQHLAFTLNREGLLLIRLGGEENLTRSLQYYREALSLRRELAETMGSMRTNDDLLVTLANITLHPHLPRDQRLAYLRQALSLAQAMLQKTGKTRYQDFVTRFAAQLQKLDN